jgi:hypothetical protein
MALRSAPHRSPRLLTALTALIAVAGGNWAQAAAPIFNEVHTIAGSSVAVPQEFTFTVSLAGDYTVTVTDLGKELPQSAPLQVVEVAVTNSADALVGAALVGAGTLKLDSLTTGSYTIHVIGLPGDTPGSGPFGIEVDDASMTSIAAFQGVLALPSQALPNGLGVLSDTFTPQAGSGSACAPPLAGECYTVSLNDLQVPQSLTANIGLLLIRQGDSTPVITLPTGGATPNQATVALTPGFTYSIIAFGEAVTGSGGLFSAVVTPGDGGAPIYGRAVPVGTTTSLGSPGLAAGSATFTLTDLKYPAQLTQIAGVVTLTGQPVAPTLTGAGSQVFTASAGTYQVFAAGTAAAGVPGAGSFAVQLTQSGLAPFGTARGVTAAGSALTPYSFDAKIGTAGSYTLSLTDFQFPKPFATLEIAATQSGALLGAPLTGVGNASISPAAGPLTLLVFAQPNAGGGLFGINIAAVNGGASAFSVTQGVGALFSAAQFSATQQGNYAVTATDLGFPASFLNFDTIVTQGTTQVGEIFGGGTFLVTLSPGIYFINFLAQPTGADQAGTYALRIASAPPAPVVKLSTDNSQVTSGSTVDVIWSSQNATSCTASGGWSGKKATSGTITSAPLTANTTFTLMCTGSGGTATQSVTVTVTPSSGGGGGSLDPLWLALLAWVLLVRGRAAGAVRRNLDSRGR